MVQKGQWRREVWLGPRRMDFHSRAQFNFIMDNICGNVVNLVYICKVLVGLKKSYSPSMRITTDVIVVCVRPVHEHEQVSESMIIYIISKMIR